MKIAIFTICRHAVAQNGLLTITDSFPSLRSSSFPLRATFTIATRLFFSADEEGQCLGWLRFSDPDGRLLLENRIDLQVPIFPQDGTGIYIDSVGAFQCTLKTAGEYQFSIGKDGEDAFIFPFYVERA